MKSCLQREMDARNLDWIILSGDTVSTPDIRYILGKSNLIRPTILIRKKSEPVVVYEPMEREEAVKSGMDVFSREDILPRSKILALPGEKDRQISFFSALLDRFSVSGNVLFSGNDEILNSFAIHEFLISHRKDITIAAYENKSLFQTVRQTKEDYELDLLRDVSVRTMKIFGEIFSFLRKSRLVNGVLKNDSGASVLLGDIRKLVLRVMAAESLTPEQIPIIAMGKDGSSPHCRGTDSMEIKQGMPIVMDISPKCSVSGYFSDVTRTVCVGKAPDQLCDIYSQVKQAYEIAVKSVACGKKLSHPDKMVSEYFRSKKHPVVMDTPGITKGYTHSLGHGVGLEIHELPRVSAYNDDDAKIFQPSMAFTIEPGLYYGNMDLGVRLENTFCLDADGKLENLTEMPMELEIWPQIN